MQHNIRSAIASVSQNKRVRAIALEVMGGKASVKIAGSSQCLYGLPITGGNIIAGQEVFVDYTTGTPVVHSYEEQSSTGYVSRVSTRKITTDPDIPASAPINEAPLDGKTYGRNSAAWIEITSGSTPTSGSDSVEEAPIDGKQYARKDAEWVEVTSTGSQITSGSYELEIVDQVIFSMEGALTTGSNPLRIYNMSGRDREIVAVTLALGSLSSGSPVIVDIHKNDTTIFTNQSHRPSITAGSYTAETLLIDVATWSAGEYLTMAIDQIGSDVAGSNIIVQVLYKTVMILELVGTPTSGSGPQSHEAVTDFYLTGYDSVTGLFTSGSIVSSGLEDAPADGKSYARKDNEWVEITSTTTGSLIQNGTATGGTVTEIDGYRIHTFLSSGSFLVESDIQELEYLIVGGGGPGGGGGAPGGGGGAGGFKPGQMDVLANLYNVVVGLGGTPGNNGSNSSFNSITAIGGGKGSSYNPSNGPADGGSGGGAGYTGANVGGAGTEGQGNKGGETGGGNYCQGGGGGAGEEGHDGVAPSTGGDGGDGLASSISGSPVYYAGGGGAPTTAQGAVKGLGGLGGGGDGSTTANNNGSNGQPNTGGGGGAAHSGTGGRGGSGIVILRYPIEVAAPPAEVTEAPLDGKEYVRSSGSWVEHTSGSPSASTELYVPPGGRLTLASNSPVITSTQTGKSLLYYLPYISDEVQLWDGDKFATTKFISLSITTGSMPVRSEPYTNNPTSGSSVAFSVSSTSGFRVNDFATISSSAGNESCEIIAIATDSSITFADVTLDHTTTNPMIYGPAVYDVWGVLSSGSLILDSSMWTDTGARDVEIVRFFGRYVKDGDPTRLYLGSVAIDPEGGTTNRITDNIGRAVVWNYYNRVDRYLSAHDPTNSWTYSINSFRAANNNRTVGQGKVIALIGVVEDACSVINISSVKTTFASVSMVSNGIGINSKTNNAALSYGALGIDTYQIITSLYSGYLPIGLNKIQRLEFASSAGGATTTWYGDNNSTAVKTAMTVSIKG